MGRRPVQILAFAGGLLLLAVTWYALFWCLAGATELLLVPWDTTPQRPPVGTLAREVNDFFEGPPGAYLPAATIVGAGMVSLVVGAVRRRCGAWLPVILAAANSIFMVLASIAYVANQSLFALRLPPPQTGYDLGYQRTWPAILVAGLLLGLLLCGQWWLALGGRREERGDAPS
ncbi:MAG TPA: hypothetical protein PLJ35_02150 [Anaerolineae bacterium]|nr:hypothetical protein [Anaerolineae bacterium]HOQ97606.1 hypothetical protein [Anaerolineae bacterium]HPL27385.1 hypothetical protein [Anaerolineae bacterium]